MLNNQELYRQPLEKLNSKLAIVINANARSVDQETRVKIEQHLPPELIKIFESASAEQAEKHYQQIIDERFGYVLPYGGDGTVMKALNTLIQRSNGAKILPTFILQKGGTGNALHTVVGAKNGLSQLEKIAAGADNAASANNAFSKLPVIKIPLLEVYLENNIKPIYTFCAGKGLEAEVIKTYEAGKKETSGRWGYVSAILTTICQNWNKRYANAAITCNRGRVLQASGKHDLISAVKARPGQLIYEGPAASISAGSAPFFGYGFKALPLANAGAIDPDGLMHLRIFTHQTQKQFIAEFGQPHQAWKLFKGTYRSQSIVELLVHDITLEMEGAAQAAGDVLPNDPFSIRIAYSKIKMPAVDLSRI